MSEDNKTDYHLPASHALVLTLILVIFFVLLFACFLWRSCGRAVDAEFVALGEARAQRGEGAAQGNSGAV